MILTLYYMYATFVQWWRLGTLRQKLNGTLNKQNALLLCSSTNCIGHTDAATATSSTSTIQRQQKRSLENLLYQHDGRIACTIVPRQKLHLGQWAAFPKDRKCFPIHYGSNSSSRPKSSSAKFHLLLQASLDHSMPQKIDIIKMEKFGELVAWRASDYFEVILRTDLERVTILLNSFRFHGMGVNHDLPLVKIETVDIDGTPGKIKYDRRPSKFKFAHGPAQFQQFTTQLRQLYAKINENLNPKIMIENGTTSNDRKPVSEVKPMKKQTSKNTLEVHHASTGAHKKGKPKQEASKKEKEEDAIGAAHKEIEKVAKHEEKRKHKEHHKVVEQKAKDPKDKDKPKEKDEDKPKKKEKLKEEVKDSKKEKPKDEVKDIKKEEAKKPIKVEDVKVVKVEDAKVTKVEEPPAKATLSVAKKSYSDVTATPGTGKNLQRQNATSSKETSPNRTAKPPNILVYADTSLAKDNVKSVLKMIINKDKYTVYDFPASASPAGLDSQQIWNSSTTLVIVCGSVPQSLTPHLLDYLVNGGQLLCLCSDLLYSVLQPFSTAEVREHELVRFTYGDWKRVKMMHHIFCYQASPAKKQFSRDSSDTSMNGAGSTGSSPVAPRTPSIVDIQHNGMKYTIQVQILGAEETWQTPSLLLASVRGNNGKAVFSQVHLEVDPTQYQDDESKYAALRDSNQARLEILKHILSHHLDIDCNSKAASSEGDISYGPGYFLGRHDLKLQMLNESSIVDNKLQMPDLELQFFTKNVEPPEATASKLPIMVLRCPTHFSTVEYFDTLKAERVGRIVIYADVMASSQRLLASKLYDGLAVIARRQTEGKGRAGNVWLSPEGCAMFSLQLHVPLDSHLGRSLPLVQHLVMVAVVTAIRQASAIEDIPVKLKWPNDLYAYGNVKIGGLVATSIADANVAIVNVGCGINLDNREPTICINDMIKDKAAAISPERFFASTFNQVEALVDSVQAKGIDYLLELYYENWLHSDANITVTTADGHTKNVTIRGVDSYGFLQVVDETGALSSVQPDGNTFDMLRGLIAPKLSS